MADPRLPPVAKPRLMSCRILRSVLSAVAILALAPAASAQPTAEWTGGGGDANWTTVANWTGNNPPGGSFVNVLFDGNSTQNLTTVNNISGLSLNTIGVGPVLGGTGQPAG